MLNAQTTERQKWGKMYKGESMDRNTKAALMEGEKRMEKALSQNDLT
jgi:hypothetical protein